MNYYWKRGDVVEGCCDRMRRTVADGGISIVEHGGRRVIAIPIDEPQLERYRIDYCPWCGSHEWNHGSKGMLPFPDLQRVNLASALLLELDDDDRARLRTSLKLTRVLA